MKQLTIRAPFRALILALLLPSVAIASGGLYDQPSPWWHSLNIHDLDGKDMPFDGKWLVLAFLDVDCPVSNAYVPVLNELARDFAPKGVRFVGVYSESEKETDRMKRHAREFLLGFPTARDQAQRLKHVAGTTYSSEVAVFDAKGTLLYRGRIDNHVGENGASRPRATQHDLRMMLDRLCVGDAGPFPSQNGFGCPLPDSPSDR